jgi:hypothetical protein
MLEQVILRDILIHEICLHVSISLQQKWKATSVYQKNYYGNELINQYELENARMEIG